MQRQPGEFGVQVIGGLTEIIGLERFAGVDHFLDHVAAAGDDDDEHAHGAERHELDAVEHRRRVRRADREADGARGLREHVRHLRQQRVDQTIRAVAAQPRLDRRRRAPGALRLEQEIDVEAVASVGWNASRGGVRLGDEAVLFESRQDAAHRRRRYAESGRRDQ